MMGATIPDCDATGGYAPVQCSGSTGYCWCVDEANAQIAGTEQRANREMSATCSAMRTGGGSTGPATPTAVRLVNSLNPSDRTSGILEASVDGAAQLPAHPAARAPRADLSLRCSSGGTTWGPVCDDYFDQNDFAAEVVCRMMGFDAHQILSSGSFTQCDVSEKLAAALSRWLHRASYSARPCRTEDSAWAGTHQRPELCAGRRAVPERQRGLAG